MQLTYTEQYYHLLLWARNFPLGPTFLETSVIIELAFSYDRVCHKLHRAILANKCIHRMEADTRFFCA